MSSVASVAVMLRALADAKDDEASPFRILQATLSSEMRPELSLTLRRHEDRQIAYVALGLGARRADGSEVLWSVSVMASPSEITVAASVEVSEDADWIEVFGLTKQTDDADEAAALVARYATAVCAQRQWISDQET